MWKGACFRLLLTILCVRSLAACSASTDPAPTPSTTPSETAARDCVLPTGAKSVTLHWTANRESAVNRTGGGYRVYVCDYSGFSLSRAIVKEVPYVSGLTAPTTLQLTGVDSGNLYVRVVAFSALNAPSSTAGSASAASSQALVVVP